MNQHRRIPVAYDPSTDSNLTLWVDPSDSSTNSLLDTGGGSISNGETVGTVKSKKGTARNFTQWGTNTRPTWDSTGMNGIGALRFVSPSIITTQTTMSDFATMSGCTVMIAQRLGTHSATNYCCFGFTMLDTNTGSSDVSMIYIRCRNDFHGAGGRRTRIGPPAQNFQSIQGTVVPANPAIVTASYNYASAKLSLYASGVQDNINATWQDTGTTHASEPFAISIGGFAQQTGNSIGLPFDGWVGEILIWNQAMTPDQLFLPHYYMRRKWTKT